MNATGAFPMARKALESIIMAERQGCAEMDFIKWSTLNQEAGKVLFTAYRKAHLNLVRLKKKKVQLLHYLATRGRAARRPPRHESYHKRIMEDYFGIHRDPVQRSALRHCSLSSLFLNSRMPQRNAAVKQICCYCSYCQRHFRLSFTVWREKFRVRDGKI